LSDAGSSNRAQRVTWIVSDVTTFTPDRTYALWHDRAVFHFLTQEDDRRAYIRALEAALPAGSGAHVILGTFALDGPTKCSGLDVRARIRVHPRRVPPPRTHDAGWRRPTLRLRALRSLGAIG
jgi:hypothetical protein